MKQHTKKHYSKFSAFLMLVCMLTTTTVSSVFASTIEQVDYTPIKLGENNTATVSFKTDELGVESSIFAKATNPRDVLDGAENMEEKYFRFYGIELNSKVGKFGLVRINQDGTYSPLVQEVIETPKTEYEEAGSYTNAKWSDKYKTLEEAKGVMSVAKTQKVSFTGSDDVYNGTALDYTKASKVLVFTEKGSSFEQHEYTMYDFIREACSIKNSDLSKLDLRFTVDNGSYKVDVLFDGKVGTSGKKLEGYVSEEVLESVNIGIYESDYPLVQQRNDNPEKGTFTYTPNEDGSNNIYVNVVTNYRNMACVFDTSSEKIDGVKPEDIVEAKTTTVYPNMTVSGIPSTEQNDIFSVSLNTDIPCALYDEATTEYLGSTEKGAIEYTVSRGNGDYNIRCVPLNGFNETDTLVTYYEEKVNTFKINCFSDSFIPTDDSSDGISAEDPIVSDTDSAEDIKGSNNLNEDFDISELNGTNGLLGVQGILAKTGIEPSTLITLIVSFLMLVGTVLLAVYKRDWLKRFLSSFLAIALITTMLPIMSKPVTVKANETSGGNGGNYGTTSGAATGDYCFHANNVGLDYVYMIYPIDLTDSWNGQSIGKDFFTSGGGLCNTNMHNLLASASWNYGVVLRPDDMSSATFDMVGSDTYGNLFHNTRAKSIGLSDFCNYIGQGINSDIFQANTDSLVTALNTIVDTKEYSKKSAILGALFPGKSFQNIENIQLVVEIYSAMHRSGEHSNYLCFSSTTTEYNKDSSKYTSFLSGYTLTKFGDLGSKSYLDSWAYKKWALDKYSNLQQVMYGVDNNPRNVEEFTKGGNWGNYSGLSFNFYSYSTPPKIEYDVFRYAALSKGKIDGINIKETKVAFNTILFKRKQHIKIENGKTTYKYTFSSTTDGTNWKILAQDVDTSSLSKIEDLNNFGVDNGYAEYKTIADKKSYIYGAQVMQILNPISASTFITSMNNPNVKYKYVGKGLTSGEMNIGKTYELTITKNYAMSHTYDYLSSMTTDNVGISNIPFSGEFIRPTNNSQYQNSIKSSGNSSFWRANNFDSGIKSAIPKGSEDFKVATHIPASAFVEYKNPPVTSTIYRVQLNCKMDGVNIDTGDATKVKDITYDSNKSGSYNVTKDTKYIVAVPKGTRYNKKTNITTLSDIARECFSTYTSRKIGYKDFELCVGTNTDGKGYDIYLFDINTDNLNLSDSYKLEAYQINRVYDALSTKKRLQVFTAVTNDGYSYKNLKSATYSNYLYQLQGTAGKVLKYNNGALSTFALYGARPNNGKYDYGYQVTSRTNYYGKLPARLTTFYTIGTGDSEKLSYVKPLVSYNLELVRTMVGDNKVLSSMAIGNKKDFNNKLKEDNALATYGLTLGTTARVNDFSSDKSATVNILNNDVNTYVFEGRYYYNKLARNENQHSDNEGDTRNRVVEKNKLINDTNFLLGYNALRWKRLTFTASVNMYKYNSNNIGTGKANKSNALAYESTDGKTAVVANDIASVLYFYPEVNMQMSYAGKVNDFVPTIGEYKRSTNSVALAGIAIKTNGTVTGKTTGDMPTNTGSYYRGSDVTLDVDSLGMTVTAFGYGLDIINKDTDGTLVISKDDKISYNSVVGDGSNVRKTWGNPTNTSQLIADNFNNFITNELKNYSTTLSLKTDGKQFSNFDISFAGGSFQANKTVNDMTFPITIEKGAIKETEEGYIALIAQIKADYNCDDATAKQIFENSGIFKAIVSSLETCNSSNNKSGSYKAANGKITLGNGTHWYDESTRTFVVRRYSNNSVRFGDVVAQDKIDMSINKKTSGTSKSGINIKTANDSPINASWFLTVSRKGYNNTYKIVDNKQVTGADFKISSLSTEDIE